METSLISLAPLILCLLSIGGCVWITRMFLREQARAHQLEIELNLAQAQLELAQQQKQSQEVLRDTMTLAAKATLSEVGQQLTSQLLTHHKREAEAQQKQMEERAKASAEGFLTRFAQVSESLGKVSGQIDQHGKSIHTLWRAMSTPAGVGQMTEISLENLLEKLGLQRGRDYFVQRTISGPPNIAEDASRLRPDIIIRLPGNRALVLDSKASKFLLELAEIEGEGKDTQAAQEKFSASMQRHLRDLSRKSYEQAVSAELSALQPDEAGQAPTQVTCVMYVASEAMIERIYKADPAFLAAAMEKDIPVVGPSGLLAILHMVSREIALGKQAEHHERLITLLPELLENFATALDHLDGVGRSIRSSAQAFDKFSRSLNARLLPKLHKMQEWGVRANKAKPLPSSVATFSIHTVENAAIEEESSPPTLLEKRA